MPHKARVKPPRYKVPKLLNENISLVDISTKEDEKLDHEISLPLIEEAPFYNFCEMSGLFKACIMKKNTYTKISLFLHSTTI